MATYRRTVAGFIWQQTSRNLLPCMTARQNVLLPMRPSLLSRRERLRRAGLLLDTLGIAHWDPAMSSQVRRTIAIRDGKTSSETIRHATTDEQGTTTLHAREYATLDREGRVQLRREMTTRLGMRHRVELQEEPDHIGVWPDQAADQERE